MQGMMMGQPVQTGMMGQPAHPGMIAGQLNQMGQPLQMGMMGQQPVRSAPAPPPPKMNLQQPVVSADGNLILSRSFNTSPSNEEDFDPLAALTNPQRQESIQQPVVDDTSALDGDLGDASNVAQHDNHKTFYIDEADSGEQENLGQIEMTEEEKKEAAAKESGNEDDDKANTEETPATTAPKKGFFSMFTRSQSDKAAIVDGDTTTDQATTAADNNKAVQETDDSKEKGRGGNEQKFMGEGQAFKGKLIGVLEVKDARGDKMCQDALQELKMAIKASGEHKQKINIQIAVDGLKIRDEKTGDCLYHHPVHKISFIAQDMTDGRAFGYIYGSPENGHRFFGIKTEKASGQVVVAMRDLFQVSFCQASNIVAVVFELKKKEIEEAKNGMESAENQITSAASFPSPSPVPGTSTQSCVDDLLGLESQISAIQAGIQQIDKITPTPPLSFQTDSMIPFSLSTSVGLAHHQPTVTLETPMVGTLGRTGGAKALNNQQGKPVQQKKPVAVMNTNPPKTNGFDTAPFLPPPPGKPGRRTAEDKYAALETIQQQQQQQASQQNMANISTGHQLQGLFNTSNDAQLNQSMGFNGSFGFTQQPPSSQISQVDGNIFGSSSAFGASSQQQNNINHSAAFGGAFSQLGSFAATTDQSSFGQQPTAANSFPQRPLAGASSSELLGSLQPVVAQPPAFPDPAPAAFPPTGGTGAMSGFPGAAGQMAGYPASSAGSLPGYGQAVSQAGQQQTKAFSFANTTASNTKTTDVFGNLDSLFTDLDPLGTGKSKPYVDKKDFFVTKQSPIGSGMGSSKDSLSNVGLDDSSLWESVCPPVSTNSISDCAVLTKAPATLSSSCSIPCRGTQRQLSENSLRVALPPEDSRLSVSPGEQYLGGGINAHSSYGSILELEASPRRYRNNDIPDVYSTSQDSPSFSSRYEEHKNSSVDSSINIPMPAEPPPALPERPPKSISRSPPPLPPKKQAYNNFISNLNREGSRPGSATRDIYECAPVYESSDNLTDQPYSGADSGMGRSQEHLLITDLVKMSVLELSQKLSEGKLPQHLTGMSLVELVDYLSKYNKQDPLSTGSSKSHESLSPRPANDSLSSINARSMIGSQQTYDYKSNLSEVSLSESVVSTSKSIEPDLNLKSHISDSYPSASHSHIFEPQPVSLSQAQSQKSIGFDDDFSQFNPIPSVSISSVDSSQHHQHQQPQLPEQPKTDVYDKYAVFRELQMEEELVNAWKSPTEEETKPIEENIQETTPDDKLDVGQNDVGIDENNITSSQEFFDDNITNTVQDTPEILAPEPEFNDNFSDFNQSMVEQQQESITEEAVPENTQLETSEHESVKEDDCQGQEDPEKGEEETDLNSNNKDDGNPEWAQFDDNNGQTSFEFSQFLSSDEQARMLGKRSSSFFNAEFMRRDSYTKLAEQKSEENENGEEGKKKFSSPKALKDLSTAPSSLQARYQNFQRFDQSTTQKSPKSSFKSQRLFPEDDGDPFGSSDWEPAFYSRTPGFDTLGSGNEERAQSQQDTDGGGWDLSFQADTDDSMFEARKPSSRSSGIRSNLEEAFPTVTMERNKSSGRSSSRASSENMFSSPFGDNFVPTTLQHNSSIMGGRTASATPPVYEGDRISNASELSCQSGDMLRTESDMFANEAGFEEFKIEAKVSKSDSVNIFSVAEDPFDDDFFKMT